MHIKALRKFWDTFGQIYKTCRLRDLTVTPMFGKRVKCVHLPWLAGTRRSKG
uniref:Transposase n=1 Tax=Mesocestoides corti TaxID=53468 RepID=A0A5K3EL34_MESCO